MIYHLLLIFIIIIVFSLIIDCRHFFSHHRFLPFFISLIIDSCHNFFMKRLDQKLGKKLFPVLYAAVLQQPRHIAHYSSAACASSSRLHLHPMSIFIPSSLSRQRLAAIPCPRPLRSLHLIFSLSICPQKLRDRQKIAIFACLTSSNGL